MSLLKKLGPYSAIVFNSPEDAGEGLADDIIIKTRKVISEKGRCVWALSGGSSILKLYDAFESRKEAASDIWDNLIVCWVDERHVPHEHEESNFGKAFRYFWQNVKGPTLIPIQYFEDIEASVEAYKTDLSNYDIQLLDIIVLGLGTDGHTASLFPQSKVLDNNDTDIAANFMGPEQTDRITMTYPMINRSKEITFIAYGSEKGKIFAKALENMQKLKYPIIGVQDSAKFYINSSFFQQLERKRMVN